MMPNIMHYYHSTIVICQDRISYLLDVQESPHHLENHIKSQQQIEGQILGQQYSWHLQFQFKWLQEENK